MARILAAQGHRDLSLAIYRELGAEHPGDQALAREAERAARGERVWEEREGRAALEPGTFDAEVPGDDSFIRCQSTGPGELSLSWQVREAGLARASALLGQPAELTARIICVTPDPEQVVRTEIWERGPVADAGAWTASQLPPSGHYLAAIGLRAQERFVAIAHIAAPGH